MGQYKEQQSTLNYLLTREGKRKAKTMKILEVLALFYCHVKYVCKFLPTFQRSLSVTSVKHWLFLTDER
jgi:hypothetical protein